MTQKLIKLTAKRETEGETPNGNPFGGLWVVRDEDGAFVDHDQWSNDLVARYSPKKGYDLEFVLPE